MKEIETRIKQFEKFYYFLTKEAPKNYIPWFFPLEPKGKNPSVQAITKLAGKKSLCCNAEWVLSKEPKPKWICEKCEMARSSWHILHARLDKEQCIEHLKKGYNIGISARKSDPLIIIDIDDAEYLNQTPKDTLVVTSRKRAGTHSFCWDKDGTAKINLPTEHGEMRSDNQYVVTCGSYVPFNLDNKKEKKNYDKLPKLAREDKLIGHYTIKESLHPKEITFNELPELFREAEKEDIEAEAEVYKREEEKEFGEGKYSELFKLKVSDIVGLIPATKRKGHPLHESDTDANFSLSKDGGIAHCWRHLVSLNAVQYLCVKAGYKPCGFCGTPHKVAGKSRGVSKIKGDKESLRVAYKEAVKLGLIQDWDDQENKNDNKDKQISLDGGIKRNISNICEDVADLLGNKDILFYRPNSQQIIEIGKIKLNSTEEDFYTGFRIINERRIITLLEKLADFGEWKKSEEKGFYFVKKSLSSAKAGVILESQILEEALPQIERIFPCPIPILYKDKLTFAKIGFDKRFSSWRPHNSPEISEPEMELKEAKEIIDKIYSEFCFKTKQDKINAIAGLLTPFVRGLFKNFNTITPGFFFLGNREGVGKDYCASIPGLVMEGEHRDDNPVSDGTKANNNEELRKKITSAIIHGRKRMHFANNKGYLNSAIFEQLLTSTYWTDRLLGKNEDTNYPKEFEISLSGNIPIRYTPDLARRVIFINLFYSEEDINARKFVKADLHGWVLENREKILSALYSLVRNWIGKEKPKSSVVYSGFFNWADICGGILEGCGYGSPCVVDSANKEMTGDNQTIEMKSLFELCYETYPNKPVKKNEIIELIRNDSELFSYFDFDRPADKIKFGLRLRTYLGRILSDIQMSIYDMNIKKTIKQEYVFEKTGHVGHVGHVPLPSNIKDMNNNIGVNNMSNMSNMSPPQRELDTEPIPEWSEEDKARLKLAEDKALEIIRKKQEELKGGSKK